MRMTFCYTSHQICAHVHSLFWGHLPFLNWFAILLYLLYVHIFVFQFLKWRKQIHSVVLSRGWCWILPDCQVPYQGILAASRWPKSARVRNSVNILSNIVLDLRHLRHFQLPLAVPLLSCLWVCPIGAESMISTVIRIVTTRHQSITNHGKSWGRNWWLRKWHHRRAKVSLW